VSGVSNPVLKAANIRVELIDGGAPVVDGIELEIAAGEILGLVGESGSGKTTTALSLFGYSEAGLKCTRGDVLVAGETLTGDAQYRSARGRLLSYVPQNPGTALNPSMRVADAIEEIVRAHDRAESVAPASVQFERVGLPADEEFGRRYPHQLSGGQQQRVCVAGALACGPALLVLDEPTTGLDVVTQDRILKELSRLRQEQDLAMLYITHDLAVVAQIANRIAVMYAGHVVEQGPAEEILRRPRHPYTRGLMASTPDHLRPRILESMAGTAVGVGDRPTGCPFAPRCVQRVPQCEAALPTLEPASSGHLVRCIEWKRTPPVKWTSVDAANERPRQVGASEQPVLTVDSLRAEYPSRHGANVAVRDVSFAVERGGCVALVGESGSGKTTIARVIAGLHPIAAGRVLLDGAVLPGAARRRSVVQRRRVQIIFQNPAEALNPRHTIGEAIMRPARTLQRLDQSAARVEMDRLLDAVRLPLTIARRYPRELSGGERQRVAIARALAAGPEVIVCDEITSALDVSVQAVVLELLRDLRSEFGVALVFITHDLGVVAIVADSVLVLESGVICEAGRTPDVLDEPSHPYTQRLLAAAPSLSEAIDRWDHSALEGPSPAAPTFSRKASA
jgi:peptide/nickel transport system ATP-binding protein